MTESERRQIIELIKKEVIPAIGCTEPIAVALCVAKAAETLGVKPEKIDVLLSANILKNAMGVGIPGTSFHHIYVLFYKNRISVLMQRDTVSRREFSISPIQIILEFSGRRFLCKP